MTGFGANQADLQTGVPVLVQQAVVDKVTGLTAAQAITAALFERDRTGRGQVHRGPDAPRGPVVPLARRHAPTSPMEGEFDKLPPQSRTFRLTPTADGHVAMITVTTPQWDGLLRAVGRDELVGHPDFDTPQKRGRNGGRRDEGDRRAARDAPHRRGASRGSRARACRAPRSPTLDDLPAVIEAISPGYLVREVHPSVGEMLHPRPAVTFDEPVTVRPAPALGEHTDEILAELDDPNLRQPRSYAAGPTQSSGLSDVDEGADFEELFAEGGQPAAASRPSVGPGARSGR